MAKCLLGVDLEDRRIRGDQSSRGDFIPFWCRELMEWIMPEVVPIHIRHRQRKCRSVRLCCMHKGSLGEMQRFDRFQGGLAVKLCL